MSCFKWTLALLAVGTAAPAWCGTLRVPSEYATINAGLDAAASGDTVLVAPGTYGDYETRLLDDGIWFSSVAFLRGDITLASEHGPGVTTLRLDGATPGGPVVLRAFGGVGVTQVQGFTVTGSSVNLNGLAYTWGDRCVIRDCVFRDFPGIGAAVAGAVADIEVYGCRFENIASAGIAQSTGTLLVEDSEFANCSPAIRAVDEEHPHATGLSLRRTRFSDNAIPAGGGGAVYTQGYADVLIEDCLFERNRANSAGGAVVGGGNTTPQVTVRRCVFLENIAGTSGAAVFTSAQSIVIEENTVYGSTVLTPQVFGSSAIQLGGTGARAFRRNVIANSTADQAVYIASTNLDEGCNVFWNNAAGNASGFVPDPTDLEADPLFCDPGAGDFHVGAGSPCLPGTGHPSCPELIGALGEGCGTVSILPTTWGKVKNDYRSGSEVRR